MTNLSKFQYRGAIVRIRLRNFMTYTDAELRPGPNLNIILGPNGTGKSAIVCCIIVGLAGEVTLTGRGSSPADFVKKNLDFGSTEIELYNDSGKNFIVERVIHITKRTKFKNEHKSDWKLNGTPVLKSDINSLTKQLNIKVDNLCQFLPQDSVTQFVKMNTCELLTNTLKAAGDNQLVEDHQKLINYTKEVGDKRTLLATLEVACKENEVNAKRLESEVIQLRQRESLVKEKAICIQKIYYLKFVEAKANRDSYKTQRDKMIEELRTLEMNNEPCKRAVKFREQNETAASEAVAKSEKDLGKTRGWLEDIKNQIENRKVDCQEEFAKFKAKQDQESQRASSIRVKKQEIDSYECKLNEIRDVDCSRQLAMAQAEMDALKNERKKNMQESQANDDKLRHQILNLDTIEREKNQISQVREKKLQNLRARNRDAYNALEWLNTNRHRFGKQIFAPMMCEINVKDPRYSGIIEHAIPRHELMSFVCQTKDDLQTFTRAVRDELKVRFNVVLAPSKTMEQFEMDSSQGPSLASLGVKAYLKDLIDAPEPIMRYLCASHNFHKIPVSDDTSEAQYKRLSGQFRKFYLRDLFYQVTISRYDRQPMTASDRVRDAVLLQYSLDTLKLRHFETEYKKLKELKDETVKKREQLLATCDELKQKWQATVERHNELQNKHDEKRRLESSLERCRESLAKLEAVVIDIEDERRKLSQNIGKINKDIIDLLAKLVKVHKSYVELRELHMTNVIKLKLASRNCSIAKKIYTNAQKTTTRLHEEIKKAEQNLRTFKAAMNEQQKIAEEKIPGFKDGRLDNKTQEKFNKLVENTIAALSDKREDLQVRIDRIYKDSNNSILNEFNRQNEQLKDKKEQIADLETNLKTLETAREEIKKSWLPKLQEVIEVIDRNYRDFMQKLSYDGQVKLDFNAQEPDNFSLYGIMISVRYRDNDQLIPLSSTRQSGGERSVATMIYMLALQTKTTVPFRCVDEINQGMDKDNERKVFELLVRTADSSSSQYFLVSPKLLNNLPYSDKMMVHVVFNGKNLCKGVWEKK